MNLSMLDEDEKPKEKVSTGNSIKNETKKQVIVYDETKAFIQQIFAGNLLTKDYVVNAVEYAKAQGFVLAKTLKDALEARAQDQNVVTFREADIAYRGKMNLKDSLMLKAAFKKLHAFLVEESEFYDGGVFALRARWNKGLEWKKTKRKDCNITKQELGDKLLVDIETDLNNFSLPLHEDEKINGIDREFLKPEHLTWEQFQVKLKFTLNTRFIKDSMVNNKVEVFA